MDLLVPLVNGFSDAGGGSAAIYRHGTTTRATCYTDFNGTLTTRTHALDSLGRVLRWVNEIVDVHVFDSSGTEVASFTFTGAAATTLEIRHSHWTGVNPDTVASELGQPLSGQTLLDKLYTSFGADDGKVLFNGAATLLKDAISQAGTSDVYNVKATIYGAVGNGTTDDTAAINLAVAAAAAAGGGRVYFPPSTYRLTGPIDLSIANGALVTLEGSGPDRTILAMDHASNNWINVGNAGPGGGFQTISGLAFSAQQTNTGYNLSDAVGNWTRYRMVNCHFGATAASCVRIQTAGQLLFEDCRFTLTGTAVGNNAIHAVNATGSGPIHLTRCLFTGPTGSFSPTNAIVYAAAVRATSCSFDFAATNAGTGVLIDARNTGASIVVGNRFNCGSASYTAIQHALTATGAFVETANSFEGSETPYSMAAGSAGGQYLYGSREGRHSISTLAATGNVNLNLRDYARWTHTQTTGGAATLTLTASAAALASARDGLLFALLILNNSGNTVTIGVDTAYFPATIGTPGTINTGFGAVFLFMARNNKWYPHVAGGSFQQ